MVSILSFFQNKKKAKKPKSRSPSPNSPRGTSGSSNGGTAPKSSNRPIRFLSLRQKTTSSSSKPYDRSIKRGSSELIRKRSTGKSSSSPKSDLKSVFKPLDLGFDVRKSDTDQLGIHGVGAIVDLRQDERDILEKLELSSDEVKLAWKVIGEALRQSDLTSHNLMLPLRPRANSTSQLYILALYTLFIRSELLPRLPTISAQYAQPISDPSAIWKERLISVLKDINSNSDIAETLKYTLRRHRPRQRGPMLETILYIEFTQAEINSSYPDNAYESLLQPRLRAGVADCLHEIFEVWSAIIVHAEENGMTPSKLSALLGWWVWGLDEKVDSWQNLYEGWKLARRRVEHLFYVWIRYQSSKTQLPLRLRQIAESYPFASSSTSSEFPPSSLPSTSRTRPTLHIILTSPQAISGYLTPDEIFNAALSSRVADNVSFPVWSAVSRNNAQGSSSLLSDDSVKFLRSSTRCDNITSIASPAREPHENVVQTESTPLYQPFLSTQTESQSRRRYRSHPDDSVPIKTTLSTSSTTPNLSTVMKNADDAGPPNSLKKQASLGILSQNGGSAWDDFQKSGFGDSPVTEGKLDLAFSPSTHVATDSTIATQPKVGKSSDIVRGNLPKQTTFDISTTLKNDYTISEEDVIGLDDNFISFVQDAQMDPSSIPSWPSFALVRLASSIAFSETANAIEQLLITVQHVPAPPSPQPRARPSENMPNRSTSPVSSRAGTPRGFKNLTETFKRSTSFQNGMNLRKSFFDTSSFSLSRHTSNKLANLPEGENRELRAPLSAQSLTPTEYTITEMGEMIKIPSSDQAEQAVSNSPQIAEGNFVTSTEREADVVTIKGKQMHEGTESGPSADTLASQWQYVGEGAEHIVFSYRGTMSIYNGQVLRLKKSQFFGNSPTSPEYRQTQTDWITTFLPKLVSPELLIKTNEVTLSENWTTDLFALADAIRPEARKLSGDLKTLVVGKSKGVIMEDTTTNEKKDGIVNLAFEIKPKWGFLPDAATIIPTEAAKIKSQNCRFCMHRHYKGHDSSAEGKFCPLDLFSSDEVRMRSAIKGLWGMWTESDGQENNWRVFIDGERVNPNQIEQLEHILGKETMIEQIADRIIPILENSGVFDTLKTLQSTLDPTDISDLASRFSSVHPNNELFDPFLILFPTTEEFAEFIELYLSTPLAGKEDSKWTLRQRMIAFSLSAIFKDCSVFVKFSLSSDSSYAATSSNPEAKGEWKYVKDSGKVKLIDLDLKPIKNLKKWKDTDDNIWKHWQKTHMTSSAIDVEVQENSVSKDSLIEQNVIQKDNDRDIKIPITFENTVPSLTINAINTQNTDASSIRALYAPTPDRTPLLTPTPSSIPTSHHQAGFAPDYVEERDDSSQMPKVVAEEQVDDAGVDGTEQIEPRRTKRSLAPSPSPPPRLADLPQEDIRGYTEEVEDTSTAVIGLPSSDGPVQSNKEINSSSKREGSNENPAPASQPSDVAPAEIRSRNDQSHNIVQAGLAGLGSVIGVAANAVHDITENIKHLQPGTHNEEVRARQPSSSPEGGNKEKPIDEEQPHETLPLTSAALPDTSMLEVNSDRPVDSLANEQASMTTIPPIHDQEQKPMPRDVDGELPTKNQADLPSDENIEGKRMPEIETPQTEFEGFFTPAETPLISQSSDVEQPMFSLPGAIMQSAVVQKQDEGSVLANKDQVDPMEQVVFTKAIDKADDPSEKEEIASQSKLYSVL
ncbi:uncharacterized protein I206_104844 [Kwoniella pini CBS 10737]|uniref:Inositol-pentakisphosphate 2-kinase n=1 Tax=Kwoniella pini CBS 10737 TaxID=1296096 RepID=A0A1B9I851_9TREE|nr:uncharacterized protein I206_02384 [Kwoniella pini CBS 10737]OCF51669.1 hypothetical protein I206_02384 [Kwoniella pini CBS 10737]